MISLDHHVQLTPKIQELLTDLSAHNKALELIPVQPEQVANLRRHSLLNSAVYSARIEGNHLTPETFLDSPSDLHKLEVQNLLDTYTWLSHQTNFSLNIDTIRTLHKRALDNLHASAGNFRTEQSAVFNSAGVAIYLTPPPQEIRPLLADWITNTHNPDQHPIITAIITHYQFEKIHPFLDGNGRVGRLIFTALLKSTHSNLIDLISIEKLIDKTRDSYYYHLGENTKDLTYFAEYLLTLLVEATQDLLKKISSPISTTQDHTHLLPRRQELLATIRDHSPCSADFLYRRFLAVPKSTLRYDLLSLQKKGLVKKLGTTRGALYST